jgi:hypothetical protein
VKCLELRHKGTRGRAIRWSPCDRQVNKDIKGENDCLINDQISLNKEATSYFNFFYKASISPDTFEHCKLVVLFPQMVNKEDSLAFYRPVTIEELKSVLFHFKKENSQALNFSSSSLT